MKNMNSNILKFYPYRVYRYVLPFVICATIFLLMAFCNFLWNQYVQGGIGYVIMIVISIIATKHSYDLTKVTVLFESDGLRLINGKHIREYYVSYQNLPYGYYCRSYRGHLFLVLSPETLCEKQIRKIVNRSARLEKVIIDNAVVIFINNGRKEEKLRMKKIISEKISFVRDV